jgi:transposase
MVGLTYAKTAALIQTLYHIKLSDGEIANILSAKHREWLPIYEKLKASIRSSPVKHYDETPWRIAELNMGYAWVASDANTTDTVYNLAAGRGGGFIKDLHGDSKGVYITDGYGAYRNLSGQQQLCWAHLYRAIRDLVQNQNLPKSKRPHVNRWYKKFSKIYETLRTTLVKPYDSHERQQAADKLWQQLATLAKATVPKVGEPDKLRRLKAQILEAGKERLFACLIYDTPCDNNRAERDLRQLVIKRKQSLGSKTERGARVLSTILSVCTSTYRREGCNYFGGLGV